MRVYVLTSDKYVHCLPPFAYLFNKYWDDRQEVVIAGFEKQSPKPLPRNFRFLSLGQQDTHSWGSGALSLLDNITEEHFILLLEDYFLSAPIDLEQIDSLSRYIAVHEGVVKIDLSDDRLKVPHADWEAIDGYPMIVSAHDSPFQMSVQAAIWSKTFMRRFLNAKENAWMSEKNGTRRIIKARNEDGFNGLILGSKRPPVKYINAIGGEGHMPDTWAWKYFPHWMTSELQGKGLI